MHHLIWIDLSEELIPVLRDNEKVQGINKKIEKILKDNCKLTGNALHFLQKPMNELAGLLSKEICNTYKYQLPFTFGSISLKINKFIKPENAGPITTIKGNVVVRNKPFFKLAFYHTINPTNLNKTEPFLPLMFPRTTELILEEVLGLEKEEQEYAKEQFSFESETMKNLIAINNALIFFNAETLNKSINDLIDSFISHLKNNKGLWKLEPKDEKTREKKEEFIAAFESSRESLSNCSFTEAKFIEITETKIESLEEELQSLVKGALSEINKSIYLSKIMLKKLLEFAIERAKLCGEIEKIEQKMTILLKMIRTYECIGNFPKDLLAINEKYANNYNSFVDRELEREKEKQEILEKQKLEEERKKQRSYAQKNKRPRSPEVKSKNRFIEEDDNADISKTAEIKIESEWNNNEDFDDIKSVSSRSGVGSMSSSRSNITQINEISAMINSINTKILALTKTVKAECTLIMKGGAKNLALTLMTKYVSTDIKNITTAWNKNSSQIRTKLEKIEQAYELSNSVNDSLKNIEILIDSINTDFKDVYNNNKENFKDDTDALTLSMLLPDEAIESLLTNINNLPAVIDSILESSKRSASVIEERFSQEDEDEENRSKRNMRKKETPVSSSNITPSTDPHQKSLE